MTRTNTVLWGAAFAGALVVHSAWSLAADAPMPKGFSSFGPDQTLADIGKLEWQPLNLEGLQPGPRSRRCAATSERAVLRFWFAFQRITLFRTIAIPAMNCMSG